jgi:hypothetical protein
MIPPEDGTPGLDLTQLRVSLHELAEVAAAPEEAFEIYCNPCSSRISTNRILNEYADALLRAAAPLLLEEVRRLRQQVAKLPYAPIIVDVLAAIDNASLLVKPDPRDAPDATHATIYDALTQAWYAIRFLQEDLARKSAPCARCEHQLARAESPKPLPREDQP